MIHAHPMTIAVGRVLGGVSFVRMVRRNGATVKHPSTDRRCDNESQRGCEARIDVQHADSTRIAW
jgi:hypothetical protein